MSVRAVDSNVRLRDFVHDDPAQAARAQTLLRERRVCVPVTVILESLQALTQRRRNTRRPWAVRAITAAIASAACSSGSSWLTCGRRRPRAADVFETDIRALAAGQRLDAFTQLRSAR
jgi:predicted nucleic acid-binding protein